MGCTSVGERFPDGRARAVVDDPWAKPPDCAVRATPRAEVEVLTDDGCDLSDRFADDEPVSDAPGALPAGCDGGTCGFVSTGREEFLEIDVRFIALSMRRPWARRLRPGGSWNGRRGAGGNIPPSPRCARPRTNDPTKRPKPYGGVREVWRWACSIERGRYARPSTTGEPSHRFTIDRREDERAGRLPMAVPAHCKEEI